MDLFHSLAGTLRPPFVPPNSMSDISNHLLRMQPSMGHENLLAQPNHQSGLTTKVPSDVENCPQTSANRMAFPPPLMLQNLPGSLSFKEDMNFILESGKRLRDGILSPPESPHSDIDGHLKLDEFNESDDAKNSGKNMIDLSDSSKRYRTSYTQHQTKVLEDNFKKERYISRPQRAQLANELGLPENTIKVWFQNRRMKEKRQSMMLPTIAGNDPHLRETLLRVAQLYYNTRYGNQSLEPSELLNLNKLVEEGNSSDNQQLLNKDQSLSGGNTSVSSNTSASPNGTSSSGKIIQPDNLQNTSTNSSSCPSSQLLEPDWATSPTSISNRPIKYEQSAPINLGEMSHKRDNSLSGPAKAPKRSNSTVSRKQKRNKFTDGNPDLIDEKQKSTAIPEKMPTFGMSQFLSMECAPADMNQAPLPDTPVSSNYFQIYHEKLMAMQNMMSKAVSSIPPHFNGVEFSNQMSNVPPPPSALFQQHPSESSLPPTTSKRPKLFRPFTVEANLAEDDGYAT